ncbi:unnamed protein product [Prorocentrum cordatum]|uniref:EF-hand domain-containing protein n=1 Tax=Prorocentrum cordatum TaxID=2364126 RepID=A0ABN9X767_9DINO|nr:unnamed protein product [Polarella glacialis]
MTGDMEPAEALTGAVAGKLCLVGFMVCSNWAVLAILTSVVSDNMITSSRDIAEKELRQCKEAEVELSREKLAELFGKIDADGNGSIDEIEWEKRVMGDGQMVDALCAAVSSLGREELKDAFNAVQSASRGETAEQTRRQITLEDFVQYLVKDCRVKADKRSILKIRQQLVSMEHGSSETRKLLDGMCSQLADLNSSLQSCHAAETSVV